MSQSPESISSNSDNENSHHNASGTSQAIPDATNSETLSPTRGRPSRPKVARNGSSFKKGVEETYSPHDARAMSPRRPSEETEVLEEAARNAVKEQARQLQLSIIEIAESIELVKADHDKLERQNQALQDYIGGLTRSMSKGQTAKGLKSSGK